MRKKDFTITKRQLGLVALCLGGVMLVGTLGYDALGFGDPDGGFGPSQQLGLALSLLAMALGASLIPLGNRPA